MKINFHLHISRKQELAQWALRAFIVMAVLVRIYLIFFKIPFTSDNAILGLMAKHILEGREYPYLFYGALYFGTFPAYFLAGLYAIFGFGILSYKLYSLIFSICIFLSLIRITKSFFRKKTIAFWTAFLLIFPPYKIFIITIMNDYLTFLLMGILFIWLINIWMKKTKIYNSLFWLIGFFAGLGWYTHPMFINFILLFLIIYFFRVIYSSKKNYLLVHVEKLIIWSLCFAMGSFFYWLGIAKTPYYFNPLGEISFHSVNISSSLMYTLRYIIPHFFDLDRGGILSTGFYITILCFILWQLFIGIKKCKYEIFTAQLLLSFLFIITVLIYSFTPSAHNTNNSRHLLPLIIVFPIMTALLLNTIPYKLRLIKYTLASTVLVFNLTSVFTTPFQQQNYDNLLDFLNTNHLQKGFADYWISYKLVFFTDEKLIISPFWDVDRYEQYTYEVIQSPDKFYLFDMENQTQTDMSLEFERNLDMAQIKYKKESIDNFTIFYSLTVCNGLKFVPVKYFSPVYEEFTVKNRPEQKTKYKDLFFNLSLPPGLYTFAVQIQSDYFKKYEPDMVTGIFAIKDPVRGTVIGKTQVTNEDFLKNSYKQVQFKTYSWSKKWIAYIFLFEEQTMYVNYVMVY